jgi:two-component system alkaline phosphatase synthesis response regulator PhoP
MVKKKAKILFVDDQEHILELVKEILEKEGHKVITVTSGKQCLKLLETMKPDLILMDVMMPGMTGKETIERIRANSKTKHLKIAYLTVTRSAGFEKKTMEKLGVLDYITKPFDREDLANRVKRMLEL